MHDFLIFSLNNPYIPKECSTPLACGLNDQNVVAIYKLQPCKHEKWQTAKSANSNL